MKCFSAFLAAAFACASGFAQSAPSFEVASIKVNHSGVRMVAIQPEPGGRFNATNISARQLITFAYGIKDGQISGGPSWIDSEHYDISAKPESKATATEMKQMLQSMLAERFKLVVRRETKEMPVYVMSVAKNGPKLEPYKDAGEPADAPPPPPPGPGRGMGRGRGMMISPGQLNAQGATASDFADILSRILGRTVIDKTALTGRFNFHLKYTPDENQMGFFGGPGGGPGPGREGGGPPPPDPNGPSIYTAMQDQLGLKLESTKGPVEVYVIGGIEKPSEN